MQQTKSRKDPTKSFGEQNFIPNKITARFNSELEKKEACKSKNITLGLIVACVTCLIGIASVVAGWQTLPILLIELVLVIVAVVALRRGYEVF